MIARLLACSAATESPHYCHRSLTQATQGTNEGMSTAPESSTTSTAGAVTRLLSKSGALRTGLAAASCGLIPLLLDGPGATNDRWSLLANLLPWIMAFLVLLALSRKPMFAGLLTWLLALTVFAIHRVKLRELGLPLVPSDLMVFTQVLSSPELYWRYVSAPAMLPLLIAGLSAWCWRESPVLPLASKRHGVLTLVAVCLLASSLLRWQPWPSLYDQSMLQISFWNPAQGAERSGVVAHFMLLHQNTRNSLPVADPAELSRFEETLAAATPDEFPPAVAPSNKVDLIVVQSESFFDPGDLADINAADHIPELLALAQHHPHGRLSVPTFGGLTSRTEFEFLTGFPLAATPEVQYPYQGLVHRPMYSLAWALRHLGYQTRAVHPYDPSFYGRRRVYPLLGFDAFHSAGEFERGDYHGYYISDEAMNRRIIEIMASPQPTFLFAVSIENHGPWDEDRVLPADEMAAVKLPAGRSDAATRPLRQFLAHLRRSDRALGELARWVRDRERPTVLLFYGDHLPNLVETYAEWPFRNGLAANLQTVPWLLLDNRTKQPAPERIDLNSAQLAGLLLERAGLPDMPLFGDIEALRQGLPAASTEQHARWHLHLAANRLKQAPDQHQWRLRDGAVAELRKWGPQGREQHSSPDEPLAIYVDLNTPIASEAMLMVNDNRMQIVERETLHLVGVLDPASSRAILATPGVHPVYLVDPTVRRRQRLGELTIRPRGRRVGGLFGLGAGPFCEVSNWGPKRTLLDPVDNPQPDGSMGLWAVSDCFPAGTQFRVDGELLPTAIEDTIATAALAPERLAQSPGPEVSLLTPTGETLLLGSIQVEPESP